jgi:hypothetical protein
MMRTGGTWDPKDLGVYFLASNAETLELAVPYHRHVLVALNSISSTDVERLRGFIRRGVGVMLDSGVFFLAMQVAERRGVPLAEALTCPPAELDGFDKLYDSYCALMGELGEQFWGYVEIDIGGRENKIKTRTKLEERGLRPIPVYHPMSDGWDYFDYLASRYDRICFGNVVDADIPTRRRILATVSERKRRYPGLWVHMLGFTPSEACIAYDANSYDSSSWMGSVRWPDRYIATAGLQYFSQMPPGFFYKLGTESDSAGGSKKAKRLAAYEAHMLERNLRNARADYEAHL